MKTPKRATPCPIVFSARDFGTLTTHQAITVSEAARVANALAAAQWQAYVEGLTEVYKNGIWGTWNGDGHRPYPEDTHVTRILPPEEIGK